VIALIAYINVRGIQMVGAVATVLEISILLPIAALCAIAATKWHHNPFSPLVPPHVPPFQVFGVGLALGLWLYSGYEQVSQRRGRSGKSPAKFIRIALAIVVPTFHRHVFSAHRLFARRARRLAQVAYRIFFDCRATRRWALAGTCNDYRSDDHQSLAAECDCSDQHAHAFDDGRRRLSSSAFSAPPRR